MTKNFLILCSPHRYEIYKFHHRGRRSLNWFSLLLIMCKRRVVTSLSLLLTHPNVYSLSLILCVLLPTIRPTCWCLYKVPHALFTCLLFIVQNRKTQLPATSVAPFKKTVDTALCQTEQCSFFKNCINRMSQKIGIITFLFSSHFFLFNFFCVLRSEA